MQDPRGMPLARSVIHPTDLSPESDSAFAHALAIALVRRAKLTILHAGGDPRSRSVWKRFPSVRERLEHWGFLAPGSPRSAVHEELALRVKKVVLKGTPPLKSILEYLESHAPDLLVLSTGGREGIPRWIKPSVSEPLARHSPGMTLFVPKGSNGIVVNETGRLAARQILVPVDREPDPQAAVDVAQRTVHALGNGNVELRMLHVGSSDRIPDVDAPDGPGWSWSRDSVEGDPVAEIARAAAEGPADLVVMATGGHEGVLDSLKGSTTEQVVRRLSCPLLAVPTAWYGRSGYDH